MSAARRVSDGRRVRLTLEFDGSDFFGWQRQTTGERTVQAAVEAAFARLPGEHGSVIGAGRTDAGVHALAMVAHVDTTSAIPDEKLRLALNAHLPRDVAVLRAASCEPDFHAQFDCRYRRYLYRLGVRRDDPRGVALQRKRVLSVFRRLDVAAMQEAAATLLGTHDFSSFATRETRSRERTVLLCELREGEASERAQEASECAQEAPERAQGAPEPAPATELRLHVAADGFLRGMVRTIVGTLLWVGKGKLRPAELPALLAARDRTRAGHNVAPHGLYFVEAGYQPWDRERSEAAVRGLVL